MQTFTTLVATFATLGAVSGSPLFTRATCGSAPNASGSQSPIQQPTGINTAADCQTSCNSNGQCQSFVFGMVDNSIKCMLFSVPASQVPAQSSQNLVAFDKACTSVPAVTPTSSNPTGAKTSQGTNQGTNQGSNNNNNNQQQGQQAGNKPAGQKLAVRDTCGATPAGSNANQEPLSQPTNINSAADCLAKCKADRNCKSFEFGPENGANVCRLFNVAASAVPAPKDGQNFQVFDVGCSI